MRFQKVFAENGHKVLLDHITFTLDTGKVGAVVAPSQSGKSTLLLLASGQATPKTGTVEVVSTGRPSWDLVGLGPVSGFAPLFDTLTVEEQVLFHAKLLRIPSLKTRVNELMEMYDLKRMGKRRVKDIDAFSYFRLSLATTLVHRPRFVLLDEPEQGLSTREWHDAKTMLRDVAETDVGVLFTSVLEEAANWADFVIYLPSGEVKSSWHSSK